MQFSALVLEWNERINLISSATAATIWDRHIRDCAQLARLGPASGPWGDLGSGAGFPGMVVAIMSAGVEMTCIESDGRKAAFLRNAAHAINLRVCVKAQRIEGVPALQARVVSARALAPLSKLLGYVERHLQPGGTAMLMKGARWIEELEAARKSWQFSYEALSSVTNPDAVILKIGELRRA